MYQVSMNVPVKMEEEGMDIVALEKLRRYRIQIK